MPYNQYNLIGPYNVLNAGRNYINQVYSGLTVNWSSSTGSYSMIKNNVQGSLKNVALGTSSMAAGLTNRAIGNHSLTFWGSGNTATTTFSAILTGSKNQCNSTHGLIGAGSSNILSGGTYTTILNGANNIISGISTYSTILAGPNHSIKTSLACVIAGGYTNTILGARGASILGATTSNMTGSNYSIILGGIANSLASSINASIIGSKSSTITNSSNYGSIIGGTLNKLDGASLGIVGGGFFNKITSSNNSISFGGYSNTIDSCSNSFIIAGHYNNIQGSDSSILAGRGCETLNDNAVAMGGGAKTRANYSFSIGNVATNTPNVANNTITLSGTVGYVIAEGGFVTGTADYAENFPFADNNPNGEDRKGYFVSLVNDGKIQIGNSNILGIISSTPGVLGDSAEHHWTDMYLKDEWDINITENYKVYSWTEIVSNKQKIKKVFEDSNGNKFKEYPHSSFPKGVEYSGSIDDSAIITYITVPKMNPDYNPDSEYIPRSQRKEWAPVGLLGKLYVRTAEKITSDYIDANADGFAVNGTKYRVIKNVRDWNENQYGIVRVFFK